MTKVGLRLLTVSFAGLLLGATASADILGSIWEFPSDTGPGNAIPANVPGTTPTVTFDLPGTSIDFQSGTKYTIGEFLTSGGATITSGASHAGDTLDDTLFNITGTVSVTTGETFTAGHDDGLTLIIGTDTVISAPGPTGFSPTTGTYTGPSGNFAFQLVYGECCGAPGDLEVAGLALVSSPVPEPTSVILMVTVLLGLVFVTRKRLANNV